MKDYKKGSFYRDLTASFKTIKEARALSVAEDTEITYKRRIEDLCREYNTLIRNRENLMLDMYPDSVTSTRVIPSDFSPAEFLKKDLQIGLDARDIKDNLEIVVDRYEALFGEFPDTEMITAILPEWKSKVAANVEED